MYYTILLRKKAEKMRKFCKKFNLLWEGGNLVAGKSKIHGYFLIVLHVYNLASSCCQQL